MELSPIEKIRNIYFKREDTYKSLGGVNGTKLRQAEILVKRLYEKNPNIKGIVTACSIYSPQAPIVAGVCKNLGVKCIICYGGTTITQLKKLKMPILASKLGAEIQIIAKTGRHNVLYANIQKQFKDYGIIEYGMCVKEELHCTEKMKEIGTSQCFKTLSQKASVDRALKKLSFKEVMDAQFKDKNVVENYVG